MYVYVACACRYCRGQKRESDHLGLELQRVAGGGTEGGGLEENAHDRRTSQVRLCQAHGTETGGHCHRKRLKTVLIVTDFVFNLLI